MRHPAWILLVLAAACATAPPPPPAPKSLIGEHGFDVAGMDPNVRACDNFYEYAVGNWRRSNPLPGTFARFGSFEAVAERNRSILRSILEESAKSDSAPGSDAQKIGDFWRACLDEAGIEARGLEPIRADLARIDSIDSRDEVVSEIHRMHRRTVPGFGVEPRGGNPVFNFGAQNDFKNSSQVIAVISQGGLGLPDRDYYLRDDGQFGKTRAAYVDHVARMFELAGSAPSAARADAQRVVELETELARASMTRVDARKPENVYHITPVSALALRDSNFDWPAFFSSIGLSGLETLNVAQPDYFAASNRLIAEAPIESWRAYLRWNLLDAAAPALPSAFVTADYEFRGRTLSGQKEIKPRWQRCVQIADVSIGGLLGKEYVRRNFTPEAKRKMSALIENLIDALREDIPTLTWMGPETQREALAKLEAFKQRIGYPDQWRDYATLEVRPDSYAGNLFSAREYSTRRAVNRVGKPDDPNEWGAFTPATVNASYNAARNFITFPAGILQPPFYDPNADDAYNYGGIGSVIGHEMTHGFDDRGSKFDAAGNLRNWWTDGDLQNFNARAQCIIDQYGEFVVEPGLNIQGKLVTGEAIADLGGVTLAYKAYMKSRQGRPADAVDGFTPQQRFFLGFAQVWAENMAIEEQRRRALTDSHAQGPFRVNGTVANMPEFREAFRCEENSPMVREASKRCGIW